MTTLIILLRTFVLLQLGQLVMADMSLAQTVLKQPKISCPQYFSYVRTDTGTVGKVTFNFIPTGTHTVRVRFSQTPPAESANGFTLSLYHTQEIFEGHIQRGEPISFRVRFPTPGVLPKVIYIALNERVVCRDSKYPDPSSTLEQAYTFTSARAKSKSTKQPSIAPIAAMQPQVTPPSTNVLIRTTAHTTVNKELTRTNIFLQSALEQATANCGREGSIDAAPKLVPLIFGGTDIEPGQFPWLAAIKHSNSQGGWDFRCGGSLISSRLVLTAAHCLVNSNKDLVDVRVELGRHNINLEHEDEEIYVPTLKSVLHSDYLKRSLPDADLGLIILRDAVRFTQRIKPICLWNGPTELSRIAGNSAVVAGWGIDESGDSSPLPKMLTVPVVSESDCRKNHILFFEFITDRTLCAGKLDGSGPLKGDSGGALMIKSGERWMLRGVVSVGINRKANEPFTYVIYCDVAQFTTWIESEINKYN